MRSRGTFKGDGMKKRSAPSKQAVALAAGGCVLILSAAAAQPESPLRSADVIIAGGLVYNGGDAPPKHEDVVIAGDKIAYVGPGAAKKFHAEKTFDARDKFVAPGFIDGHSHPEHWLNSSDPKDRNLMPWITQGTAILLMGIEAEGTPNIVEQTAKFAKTGIGANIVPFVGYRILRGPDGILGNDSRAPTSAEINDARALVKKGMCEGGWGLSINLFSAPDIYSTTEEIIPIAREAAKYGGIYHVHERDESSYSIGLMGSTLESIRIGREAGIGVQITHIKAIGPDVWGKAPEVIAAINKARAEGVNVWADQYPWTAASSGVEKMLVPRWVEDGGRAAMIKRFDDSAQLPKIKAEMAENLRKRGGPDTLLLTSTGYEWTGKTLSQMAAIWHIDPVDTAIRVVKTGGEAVAVGVTPGDANGGALESFSLKDSDVNAFMQQPWITTSSDAGANHPRTYANYPRKFQKYAVEDKIITVQEFIRSSTGREADNLHLDRRGYLKDGYFADVVVFDPKRYRQRNDYVHYDIPSEGVDELFINGKLAVLNSKVTGQLAGRTILHVPTKAACSTGAN